jgi:hypothetical protein
VVPQFEQPQFASQGTPQVEHVEQAGAYDVTYPALHELQPAVQVEQLGAYEAHVEQPLLHDEQPGAKLVVYP